MKRVVRVDVVIDPTEHPSPVGRVGKNGPAAPMPDTDEAATTIVEQMLHGERVMTKHTVVTSVEKLGTSSAPAKAVEVEPVMETCVNCHQKASLGALRLRIQSGHDSTEWETLWQRPLCVDCETTQPVHLLEYIKFALT